MQLLSQPGARVGPHLRGRWTPAPSIPCSVRRVPSLALVGPLHSDSNPGLRLDLRSASQSWPRRETPVVEASLGLWCQRNDSGKAGRRCRGAASPRADGPRGEGGWLSLLKAWTGAGGVLDRAAPRMRLPCLIGCLALAPQPEDVPPGPPWHWHTLPSLVLSPPASACPL